MIYYDLAKNWRKVSRHIAQAKPRLVRDFDKYARGMWGERFTEKNVPSDFEDPEWRDRTKKNRKPFWRYVKSGACHWIVNFALELAMRVEPGRHWRIVTSGHIVGRNPNHSTVWDGDKTLFEFNYLAFGIGANECFEAACVRILKPGKFLRLYYPS